MLPCAYVGRVRIARDLEFDQVDNAAEQFGLRLGLPVFRLLARKALDVAGESIKTASEFGVPEQSPTIALGEGPAAHKVTSSGMMSLSLA